MQTRKVAYLRQGLHDGVQQSSHPHRHFQQLQYCRDQKKNKEYMNQGFKLFRLFSLT